MNRDETLALYKKGRDAWNAWAEGLLEERRQRKYEGTLTYTWLKKWCHRATADFSCMESDVDSNAINYKNIFSDFLFPGIVDFSGCKFDGKANFTKAVFCGFANFRRSVFIKGVDFKSAIFYKKANFSQTVFSKRVSFEKVAFKEYTKFYQASFQKTATFEKAVFYKKGGFTNSNADDRLILNGATFQANAKLNIIHFRDRGRILLRNTTFTQLPDFTQTYFVVPPDLDNTQFTKVKPNNFLVSFLRFIRDVLIFLTFLYFVLSVTYVKGILVALIVVPIMVVCLAIVAKPYLSPKQINNDEEIKWRALKRMAEAGKHHILARQCFKGETLARRWHHDTPLTGAFWAGLAFEALSDFGQSFMRPLLWLGVVISLSTVGLLKLSPDTTPQPPTMCNKVVAAGLLSVNKSLFLSADPSGSVNRHLLCLYGQQNDTPTSPPNTPDEATVLMMAQVLFSVVLLFLFGHAIKARFTIS
jgi:hypothetical protein